MPPPKHIAKRVAFAFLPLLALLVLLELGLRAAPSAVAWYRRVTASVREAKTYVVTMGDSVTYGSKLAPGEPWPEQLAARLRAEGDDDVEVMNAALAGSRITDLRREQLKWINRLPLDANVVAIVLVTHNDFSSWMSLPGFIERDPDRAPLPGPKGTNLRLFNVLQWISAEDRAYESPNPGAEDWLRTQLTPIRDRVEARHGWLYVMSYPIPGPATTHPPPIEKLAFDDFRVYKHQTNRLVLHVAEDMGIRTIDLERELPVPAEYTPEFWLDHVHLTGAGSGELARVVLERLRYDGVLGG